jgi:hypothetical protein
MEREKRRGCLNLMCSDKGVGNALRRSFKIYFVINSEFRFICKKTARISRTP